MNRADPRQGARRAGPVGLAAALARVSLTRHTPHNEKVSCASAGTVIVTILAGPLNYVGVNPKLSCH